MRGIVGYIRNLADGLGPPVGTVDVNAWPHETRDEPDEADRELNLLEHELGALTVVHLEGSGSITDANTEGKFGWQMELSPGPIDVYVHPSDPQDEYRLRFPDESAQVGKAFHTDIERLGWAAGRDCLVWDAVEGGHRPAAGAWTWDPLLTGRQGNWSILSYGSGADAGRVTIRKGIAFLGGVVFSIELGDLMVPLPEEDVLPANAGPGDRWDLILLTINIDPAASNRIYGKQGVRMQQGAAGQGIPAPLPAAAGTRELVLHAVKMAAGTNVYSETYDLRRWTTPPTLYADGTAIPAAQPIKSWAWLGAPEGIANSAWTPSVINPTFQQQQLSVPLNSAYAGYLSLSFDVQPWNQNLGGLIGAAMYSEGRSTPNGVVSAGSQHVYNPTIGAMGSAQLIASADYSGDLVNDAITFVYPLTRIPSGAEGRTWHLMRFYLHYFHNTAGQFGRTIAIANLWPVP